MVVNFLSAILFFLLPVFSLAQSINGLIAKYTFNDGTARNELGASAKAVGISYVEDRFGNPASAVRLFGNVNSYLNLGTSELLKPGKGSISLWVKINAENYSGRGYWGNPIILTKNRQAEDFVEAFNLSYDLRSHTLATSCSSVEQQQVAILAEKQAELGKWYHLVETFDDQHLCFYVNGELQGCVDKKYPMVFLAGDSVTVGNSASRKNKRYLLGDVDDIYFFNRVLTPQDVKLLYEEPDPNRAHRWFRVGSWIFGILILLSAIFMLVSRNNYRKALKKEQEKRLLQSRTFEMEMKVVKAQMNPHFIFNSMNSIQQFILADDTENANYYLVKFSKLLRRILESNTDEHITVENEIDMLDKYIELESLRFGQAFRYRIIRDDELAGTDTKIPQMLIQPFVENAVWHGLLPKENDKELSVIFRRIDSRTLSCTIDDNGVGRNTNSLHVPQRKSLGIRFTQERLGLMKKVWGGEYGIEITDKKNEQGESAGTRVVVQLPIIN